MDHQLHDRRRGHRAAEAPARRPGGDGGFTMVTTALSLVIVALALALLLGTTLHSGGSTTTGSTGAPGVGLAERLQAQQSLTTGLGAAVNAASTAGGFSGVTASSLESSNPSISFVSGASSGPTTVSVVIDPGSGTSTGAATGGQTGVPDLSGVPGAVGGDGGTTDTGGTGGITLADRSSDGVCWVVWKSVGSPTWYGAQTGLASCTAPALTAPPTPGPVSSSSIGWQQGTFPSP